MLSTTTKSESDSHPASALEEIGNDALQFGESFIQASIQTPVNSVMQLVSLGHLPEIHLVAPDPNATGLEKQFQQAGSAAGTIADFMVLSKLADLGMSNFIAEPAMRQLPVSAVSGFVNGALVTPLAPGENQWNRLSNGLSQAAAFSAYSALSTRLAGPLSPLAGDTLVQIASRNAISGLVAGTIDTQAKSLLSGRGFADFGTTATNAGSWAVGGAFAGVGGRILSDVLAHRPITPFFNDVRLNDMSAPLQANQMIESTARTATGDDAVVSSTKLADGTMQLSKVELANGTVIERAAGNTPLDSTADLKARLSQHWIATSPQNAEPVAWTGDVRVGDNGALAFDYMYPKTASNVAVEVNLPTGEKLGVATEGGATILPGAELDALSETTSQSAVKTLARYGIQADPARLQLVDAKASPAAVHTIYGINLTNDEAAALKNLTTQNPDAGLKLVGAEQKLLPAPVLSSPDQVLGENQPAVYSYDTAKVDHTSTVSVLFKNQSGDWQVLTGNRKQFPFQGREALPGGFLDLSGDKVETPTEAAARELKEETLIDTTQTPTLVRIGDGLARDPRNRVIDFQFLALGDQEIASKLGDGDDLGKVTTQSVASLLNNPDSLAFDHRQALIDALAEAKRIVGE